MSLDIYLYGMTLLSNIHLLEDAYPEADTYAEIIQTHRLPGGETANAAILLANFGLTVKSDGPFLGTETREAMLQFGQQYRVDCSGMHYDPTFAGVQDLVLVGKGTRTIFGSFKHYFENGQRRWSDPDQQAIRSARIVSIDPFFQEASAQAAQLCATAGKSYVTIDCTYDSIIHQHSAANVISNEFIRNTYPDTAAEALFEQYTAASRGLVIFTSGAREIMFGRRGETVKRLQPYRINAVSTLGAGDIFRAGIVYGLFQGWDDLRCVKFAAATAASVCTRFPMALDLPGLEEIFDLMNSGA